MAAGRSIRIFSPYRPVERAKVQKMLEAARRASCAGNVMNIRAVVIWREKASEDLIDSIKLPLSYQQMQTAPVFIFWYDECMAYKGEHWVESVTELAESRRLGADLEKNAEGDRDDARTGVPVDGPASNRRQPGCADGLRPGHCPGHADRVRGGSGLVSCWAAPCLAGWASG